MKGLFDNDILMKLCACELLDEVLISFNIDDMIVLDSLYYKRSQEDWLRRNRCKGRSDWAQRMSAMLQKSQPLGAVEPVLLASIGNLGPGVDPGEAQLLTTAFSESNVILLTGDKRFLNALCSNINKLPNANMLHGKLLFLEVIILHFLNDYGLDWIKDKVVPALECDGFLRMVFGSGMKSTENNVRYGLEQEVNKLRNLLGDFLYLIP